MAITKILCAVDFSELSQKALEYAEDFASEVGAELVILHAFDDPASYDQEGQVTPADRSIANRLDALAATRSDIPITRMLHAGPAGKVICWAAENQGCNLIIMGTHGRTGVKHLVFGSTAEEVLREARCPVLTIRQQGANVSPLSEPIVVPAAAPRFM